MRLRERITSSAAIKDNLMASPPSGSPQPKARDVVSGLAILVVLIAVVFGIDQLPQPYYAIGQLVIYASLVAAIVGKLRTCLRLAKGSEYSSKLHGVVFWVVLGVFAVVADLGDLFGTENRDYINLATNLALYFALLSALELLERLLKRAIVGNSSWTAIVNTTEAATAPIQPLQQTGGA
jgi:hypothetical protein